MNWWRPFVLGWFAGAVATLVALYALANWIL